MPMEGCFQDFSLDLKQLLLDALSEIYLPLKGIMGFVCLLLMSVFYTVFEAGQGWPAEHWCLFRVTEVQKDIPPYSCMIAGNFLFPEKSSRKGKDKISFISLGYQTLFTDKVGLFCFRLFPCFFVVGFAGFFSPPYAFQCIPMLTSAE